MQRFILRENLKKFRLRLDAGVADAERAYLLRQIRSIQRELALLNAAALGVQRYRSEEHTSELQSLMRISYAVFCLKKKKHKKCVKGRSPDPPYPRRYTYNILHTTLNS